MFNHKLSLFFVTAQPKIEDKLNFLNMEDDLIFILMEDNLKKRTVKHRQPDQHNNQKYIGTINKSTLFGCDIIVN